MSAHQKRSCRNTVVLAVLGLIVGLLIVGKIVGAFDTFNRVHLIKSAFGANLTPYMEEQITSYSDGCLQFHGIGETHPLYVRFFPTPPTRTFHVSFLHANFDEDNNIGYRQIGKGFDAYTPVVVYIPRLKRLVFGYCNGMGG